MSAYDLWQKAYELAAAKDWKNEKLNRDVEFAAKALMDTIKLRSRVQS